MTKRLKLGFPKGSLQESTLELFKRAGIRVFVGTIASDSFDDTEGTEISTYDSSWTLHTSYSSNAEIANNRARCSTNSATTCYWQVHRRPRLTTR